MEGTITAPNSERVMKLFNFTINLSGLQEIMEFLAENHKKGVGCFARRMTVAEPISGNPIPCPISDSSFDAEEIKVDDE